jgi:hypothetical protein
LYQTNAKQAKTANLEISKRHVFKGLEADVRLFLCGSLQHVKLPWQNHSRTLHSHLCRLGLKHNHKFSKRWFLELDAVVKGRRKVTNDRLLKYHTQPYVRKKLAGDSQSIVSIE